MAESAAKRIKTPVTIGTHNGHFHADEALAVHMLRLLPTYRDSALVRTRDSKVLDTLHTVVDVGGVYDAERNRFDHHQREFATTFPGRPTKLSSAGLVFMHFGKAIIAQRLGNGAGEESPEVELLYNKLYENFIEALDAHDNGISSGFNLGAMVGRLNPKWNDPKPSDPEEAQKAEDEKFVVASQRIGEEFERDLDGLAFGWLPARSIVEKAFEERTQYDPEGRILVIQGQSVPWKDHLFTLEADKPSVLYVLYAESTRPDAKWRIQCVPENKDSFTSRKPLPEAWRGFRDEALDGIAGIPGCVFVHSAGFIGGNKTFEGAKDMAVKALA
ncbi:MYG1 exonuclease [Cladobotryum mycophilum]|uniref:MYG1 exonuclease n=1 Tax=Cladobotryum mycophilum TaxID=491253 RepID=A0ABR0S5U6_9HYPO